MLFKDYKFGTVGLFRSGQVLGGQKPWLLLVSGFKSLIGTEWLSVALDLILSTTSQQNAKYGTLKKLKVILVG